MSEPTLADLIEMVEAAGDLAVAAADVVASWHGGAINVRDLQHLEDALRSYDLPHRVDVLRSFAEASRTDKEGL